jgi:hypothetical protein
LITSPAHIRPEKEGQTVIVTTKEAYYWAPLFSELAGRDGEPERFLKYVRDYLTEWGNVFRLAYDTLGGPIDSVAESMFGFLAKQYGLESKALIERANAAYLSLIQKKLIEDPFKKKIAALLICLSGLFPQNVTSTTDKGGQTAIVYHSRALDVDYQPGPGKESRLEVDIKLVKIVREVYPKLIEIFDEIVGDGGDQEGKTPKTPSTPKTP